MDFDLHADTKIVGMGQLNACSAYLHATDSFFGAAIDIRGSYAGAIFVGMRGAAAATDLRLRGLESDPGVIPTANTAEGWGYMPANPIVGSHSTLGEPGVFFGPTTAQTLALKVGLSSSKNFIRWEVNTGANMNQCAFTAAAILVMKQAPTARQVS
jgi:hypothetical protein